MHRSVSGVLLVLFFASSSLFAAEEPAHNDLAEINATLKEIARTLKQQVETQKADLLLKRLTFATTQLANARERLSAIDREIALAEKDRGELETLIAARQRDMPAGDPRIGEIKSQWQEVKDRLSALHQQRITAENDIEAQRRDVREWQALLDKAITGGA
jgi:chromosome segregation ATPase